MKTFLLLTAATLGLSGCLTPTPPASHPRELRSGRIGLINPLLDVESSLEFREMRPFSHKVEAVIDKARRAGKVTKVAVYFRDLNNGPLFGINDTEHYAPASLLKVPLMFAVLKQAQSDPAFLTKKVPYLIETAVSADMSSGTLKSGELYTIDELLKAMITTSDNNAAILLHSSVDPKAMEVVYADLGLPKPDFRDAGDTLSVRDYGRFLRILYNASYLNREMSQKALGYLAGTEFRDGIVAGVRPLLPVAHKFGERTLSETERQFHDCGIVYAPEATYLLCIMTRGRNFSDLIGVVREVARVVDTEIDSQLPDRARPPK